MRILAGLFLILSLCAWGTPAWLTVSAGSSGFTGLTYWWTANADTDSGDYGTAPTVNGTVTYATGQVGNAASMDSIGNDYITMPTGIIDGSDGRVGFWINTSALTGDDGVFYSVSGSSYIRLAFSGNASAFHSTYTDGTTTITAWGTDSTLVTATWYYVELKWIYAAGDVTITSYVDGAQHGVSSNTMSAIDLSSSTTTLGRRAGATAAIYQVDNLIITSDSTIDLYTDYRNKDGI